MTSFLYYEKPLSYTVQKLMYQVLKNASRVEQGFLFFRDRAIVKAHYDPEECDKVLEAMIINKENVLTYLGRKYIPSYTKDGAIFKNQSCIQKVKIMPDRTLYIHIGNSEPHKIITDTIHVMRLLQKEKYDFIPEIKYYIETLKIAYQDTLTYNLCVTEFGFKVPAAAKSFERELKTKFGKLENVAKIKKRSVKRKFLRYHVKRGMMTWKQLRYIINMASEDYTERRVKEICTEIRAQQLEQNIIVDY